MPAGLRSVTSPYQRYSSLVHERSQLFWSVTVPVRSAVPARGATHIASKLVEGWKTPACQVLPPPLELELELDPPPPPPPPPPQAASTPNTGNSNTLNL